MTDQESPTPSQTAGRAVGVAKNWIDAVEGRSRAIVLSAILALPPIAAWVYGLANFKPASCTGGTRFVPCVMGTASPAFPIGWNGLLLAAFVIAIVFGAVFIMRPRDRNTRLVFAAAGAVIAAVACLQLVTLMGMQNASYVLAANTAWLVVPAVVGTAAAFAAISSRT